MPKVPLAQVSPWDSWVFEFELSQKDADTRLPEPVTPATAFTAWWSLTEDGPAINAAVSVGLVEATAKPGTVFGEVGQAAMIAHLGGLPLGSTVWEVLEQPNEMRVSRPYKLVRIRRMTE